MKNQSRHGNLTCLSERICDHRPLPTLRRGNLLIKHIFLDMDGVVCDFISAAFRVHGSEFNPATYPRGEWSIAKVLGITETQFWEKIDAVGEDFWPGLVKYPWAEELIACVERHVGPNWSFCTTPSRAHFSSSGKVLWIQEEFGSRFRRYHIGEDKHHFAQSQHLLIDDSTANCQKFTGAGGHAILFPQPWNIGAAENPVQHVYGLLEGCV